MAKANLTAQQLRDLLSYNPASGDFVRIAHAYQNSGRRSAVGAIGRVTNAGYHLIGVRGNYYTAHRLAWLYVYGRWPVHHIDHIDGNPLNNRINNLRECSHAQNMQNMRRAHADSASGLLGAYQRGHKWVSMICHGRRQMYLGTFNTAEEAHAAYIEAKRNIHGFCTI